MTVDISEDVNVVNTEDVLVAYNCLHIVKERLVNWCFNWLSVTLDIQDDVNDVKSENTLVWLIRLALISSRTLKCLETICRLVYL